MLHILWLLLKIIGIILLVILGLLVLAVCVIFFVPIRYEGTAKIQGTTDSVKAHLRFSWFLHLVSGYIIYENKSISWQVRYLWKKVNVIKKDSEPEETQENDFRDMNQEYTDEMEEDFFEHEFVENEVEGKEFAKKIKTVKKQKKNIFRKLKYTFCEFCDKIKSLIKKKEKLQEFLLNEIHQQSFIKIKNELGRLLRFLKPKKLKLNFHFGFEDPAVTGKVLGALCMLYPFYMDHVNLEPEFEEKILEGDAYIKGRIRGLHLFIVLCNLFFDKNIKITYKAIKNWKG